MKAIILCILLPMVIMAQQPKEKFKGQEPIKAVNTVSRPVLEQTKKVYNLNGIYVSNEFEGARVNEASVSKNGTILITILPENTPINPSPWYAFKIWSEAPETVTIKLVYPDKIKNRYDPKISIDGENWTPISGYSEIDGFTFELKIYNKALFVASQPLITSFSINRWINTINTAQRGSAGKSGLQKEIPVLEIGNVHSSNKIIILGRQHPPEVTGHLALQAFVETLAGSDAEIEKLRKNFHILVFPMVNPDGVDNGHWRHNHGGVDLNRDWSDFNQPETQAIRNFLNTKILSNDKVWFAIDFHSTHDDIYYTVDPNLKSNTPGLINQWLGTLKEEITDYEPNIKPLYFGPPTSTAFSYFYEKYGAESLVYEIGDKTPESFIKQKGEISAKTLSKILNKLIIN